MLLSQHQIHILQSREPMLSAQLRGGGADESAGTPRNVTARAPTCTTPRFTALSWAAAFSASSGVRHAVATSCGPDADYSYALPTDRIGYRLADASNDPAVVDGCVPLQLISR